MSENPQVVGAPDERRGRNAPLEFHFYCNSIPFDEDTIELRTSLGGSESALIFLARGLAKRGHKVVIYTRMKRDDAGKPWALHHIDQHEIRWFDHDMITQIVSARQPDVFVSLRMPQVMESYFLQDCSLRIVWNEDVLTAPGGYFGGTWQADEHAFVSAYHLEQYCRVIPDIRRLSWHTRNPIDLEMLRESIEGVEKDPNRLIHVSRPERAMIYHGGSPLLAMFGKMREKRPDLTLGVARYHSMYEDNPQVAEGCRLADRFVEQTEGVEWLGELDKASLYREMARAALHIYPGIPEFAETGCIAASESQACGTPTVATDIGALPETLHPKAGALIKGDCTTDDYQTAFIGACDHLLSNTGAYEQAQRKGRTHAEAYDLDVVAEQWDQHCYDYLHARYKARQPAVFDALMWRDDLRAADVIADEVEGGRERLLLHEASTNETPERYATNSIDPAQELGTSNRLPFIETVLAPLYTDEELDRADLRILDYACGNGSLTAQWARWCPNAMIDAVDYSEALCGVARTFLTTFDDGKHAGRVTVTCGGLDEIPRDDYDIIFAGEIAEHFQKPEDFGAALEQHARKPDGDTPGGRIVLTVPQGPFAGMMHRNSLDWGQHLRGHKIEFGARDIDEMWKDKADYQQAHLPLGHNERNELVGHYLITWTRDDNPIHGRDDERKITRTRPRERLAVCMIVRDCEHDVLRALKSIDSIADEVWIADTGSTDATMQLAKPYTRNGGDVWQIGTCPDAPAGLPPPGDFGWARNESVAKVTADWVLWIDADEVLQNPHIVRTYMTDNAFNGYVLRQCHLTTDALDDEMVENRIPYRFDKPVRLFRRVPRGTHEGVTYQCYAAIHEHFQCDLNDLIEPTLIINASLIAHTGYMHEGMRRGKCQFRNMPLLAYDHEKYPGRDLQPILDARDFVNLALWECGQLGPNARPVQSREGLLQGLTLMSDPKFFDPSAPYWDAVMKIYQDTLRGLDAGSEYGVYVLNAQNNMVPKVLRFASLEHLRVVQDHVNEQLAVLQEPTPITWDDESEAPKVEPMTAVAGG